MNIKEINELHQREYLTLCKLRDTRKQFMAEDHPELTEEQKSFLKQSEVIENRMIENNIERGKLLKIMEKEQTNESNNK